MKKPEGYWDRVRSILFQNAVLAVVIRYLAFFAWRFDLLASHQSGAEIKYLFGGALVAFAICLLGQLYCLRQWEQSQTKRSGQREELAGPAETEP